MSLFIGIMPSRQTVEACEKLQMHLLHAGGRLVRPDLFHITLAFLKEHAYSMRILEEIVQETGKNLSLATFYIEGIGSFKEGRIQYAAIESPQLENWYRSLCIHLDAAKIVYEQHERFQPHITLRRGRRACCDLSVPKAVFTADNLTLFESRHDEKLEYVPIYQMRIKDGNENFIG